MLGPALSWAWNKAGGFELKVDGIIEAFQVPEEPFASLSVLEELLQHTSLCSHLIIHEDTYYLSYVY